MLNNANKADGYTEVYYNYKSTKFFTDAVGNQFQELSINLDVSNNVLTLDALSVNTADATAGGALSYDQTTGVFTFAPSSGVGGIDLSDLSVATAAASGSGSLSYDDTTGVFTFTPSEEESKSIQTVSTLPTTGLAFGDICALSTDNTPYFYDGTAWRKFYLYDVPPGPGVPDTNWDRVLLRIPFNGDGDDVKTGLTPNSAGGWDIVGSPVKYGSGSLRIQGSDYIGYPVNFAFLEDQFTIEFWIYFDQFKGTGVPRGIFSKQQTTFIYTCAGNTTSETVTFGTINYSNASEKLEWSSLTMSAQTWYHLAFVRNDVSGQITLYVNGTSQGSINGNNLVDSPTYNLIIGDDLESDVDFFIDDLRISDIERYTTTFTPPSAELPTSA